MSPKIPITLLTGFFGADKSALVRRILGDPRFTDTAVVVNEFGDGGLDGALIAHSPDQVVEMTTGCLCCTVRGDIRDTLLRLHAEAGLDRAPLFERLVSKTTGLTDPIPVIATLMQDPRLVRRHALAGVVAVVDCLSGARTLTAHKEAVRQVAVAEPIVVSRADLATGQEREAARDRMLAAVTALNPRAPRLDGSPLTSRCLRWSICRPSIRTRGHSKWLSGCLGPSSRITTTITTPMT